MEKAFMAHSQKIFESKTKPAQLLTPMGMPVRHCTVRIVHTVESSMEDFAPRFKSLSLRDLIGKHKMEVIAPGKVKNIFLCSYEKPFVYVIRQIIV